MPPRDAAVPEADWALIPNLGAEEGPDWPRLAELPAVRDTAALWRLLFPAAHRLIGPVAGAAVAWPEGLGTRPLGAAFRWIDERPGAHAWLGDAPAREIAQAEAAAWGGAEPEVTRRVHDKAFAFRTAEALDYTPLALRDAVTVLEPEDLADGATAYDEIAARVAGWPDWMDAFVLKPRLGGSGRGRVAGSRSGLDPNRDDARAHAHTTRDAITRALPRLADRGGAILEPWLDRTADLSVSLHLLPDSPPGEPGVTLLGSLEQLLTPAGVPLGHLGEVDSRGRIFSGSQYDESAREAAVATAGAALAAGYSGPCGVDAFAFRVHEAGGAERTWLRPVVEFNARYTLGIVAIGVVRRLLERLKREHGLSPGERRTFLLALRPPAGHRDWSAAADALGPDVFGVDLAPEDPGPGVVFSRDRASLLPLLG